jgi:cardiolipin synthase
LNLTFTAVLSALHLLLAVGVTGHVLINKRDPGSAVAWIGIAWLSPVLGSVLYVLLGVNRVRRRALTMRAQRRAAPGTEAGAEDISAERLTTLECSARRITGRPAKTGNAIATLRNARQHRRCAAQRRPRQLHLPG